MISQGDGRHYLSAHEDGSYRAWDLELGVEVSSQWIHESAISALSYESSNRLLFSATRKGELRAHQVERGTELGRVALGEELRSLCALEGRSEVALLCASGRALIWSPESGLKLISGVFEPCQWIGQDGGELLLARGESLRRLSWGDEGLRLSGAEDLPPNVEMVALGEAGELLLGLKSGSIQCWQPAPGLPQLSFRDFDRARPIWDLAKTPAGTLRALREDGLVFQSFRGIEETRGSAGKNLWNLGRADLTAGALSADGQRCIVGGMKGWALFELKGQFESLILFEGVEPSNAVALAGERWAALSQPQGPLLLDTKSGQRRSLAPAAEPMRMIKLLEQGEEDLQVFGASGAGLWFWRGAAEPRSLVLDQPVQDIAACERGLDWCLAALDESYGVSLIDSSLVILRRIESSKPVKKIGLFDNGRVLVRIGPGGRTEICTLEWLEASKTIEIGPWIELEPEGSEGVRAVCLVDGQFWSSRGDSLSVVPLSALRAASGGSRELVVQVEERTGMRVTSSNLALTVGARLLPCRD